MGLCEAVLVSHLKKMKFQLLEILNYRKQLPIQTAILLFLLSQTESAKILVFIGGYSSHGHRVGLEPLANRLVDKGHDVTIFGPQQTAIEERPAIKHFCPSELTKFLKEGQVKSFGVDGFRVRTSPSGILGTALKLIEDTMRLCQVTMTSREFLSWVRREVNFDLIIFDRSSLSDCFYALAYKFGAKTIGYSALGTLYPWDLLHYGVSPELSSIPNLDVQYSGERMGLVDRFWNHLSGILWFLSHRYIVLWVLDNGTRVFLDLPDMPPLLDQIKNDSIILLNQDPSDSFVRSLPPFMIPVGGMHLPRVQSPGKALPQEIQEFIDGAGERGFIYISFGTLIRPSEMPQRLLDTFFDALKASRLRFLWKWDEKLPANVPDNVKMLPWFPQRDILAHPKLKAFLTQGGQVSIQEAIFYEVPLLLLPVNGDQDFNAKRIRIAGNGLDLELVGLSSSKLALSFVEITENVSYKNAARELSRALRDRPEHALDTAVWWTEYVLRHDQKVLKLLKPLAADQAWWEHTSLDLFLLTLIFAVVWTLIATLLTLYCIRHYTRKWSLRKQEKLKTS